MSKRALKITPIPSKLSMNPYIKLLYSELKELGVEIVQCDKLSFSWLMKNGRNIDILHFHWPETHYIFDSFVFSVLKLVYFFSLITFAKMLNCKIVWTSHNILGHEKRHKKLDKFGKKLLVRKVDAVVAHCDYAAKLVKETLGRKNDIHLIPHPNYISYYKNTATKEESRDHLDIPEKSEVYLLFGVVRKYKGILEMIDIFGEFDGKKVLLIAGSPKDKPLTDEILKRTKGKAGIKTYLKFIDGDDVQYFFNAADFVILPYKDIVTSGALILAMSFARPVIAPRIGCFDEILNNNTGILYDPHKPDALLDAINRAALKDKNKMGNECYKRAKAFDVKGVAELHLKMYQILLEKSFR